MCNAAYEVIKIFNVGTSRKADAYVAKYAPFFESQLGFVFSPMQRYNMYILLYYRTALAMEETYLEIIRDNNEIIDAIGDAEVMHVIEALKRDKNASFLEILSAMCECNGLAKISHQDRIVRILLGQNAGLLYTTQLPIRRDDMLINISGKRDDWRSLKEFVDI